MFAFAVLFLSIILALDALFGEISETLLRERFLDGVLTPSMAFLVSHAATIAVLQSNANTLALAAEAGVRAAGQIRALSPQEYAIIQTAATKSSDRKAASKHKGPAAKSTTTTPAKRRKGNAVADERPMDASGQKLWSGSQCPHDDVCTRCTRGGSLCLCAYCAGAWHWECLTLVEAENIRDDEWDWRCPECDEAGSDDEDFSK